MIPRTALNCPAPPSISSRSGKAGGAPSPASLAACSFNARPKRRSSTSRIIAKSSPGAIGPRIEYLR